MKKITQTTQYLSLIILSRCNNYFIRMIKSNQPVEDSKISSHQQSKARKWIKMSIQITLILFLSVLVLNLFFEKGSNPILRILEEQSSVLREKEQYKDQLREYFDDSLQFDGLKLVESNFQYSPTPTAALRQLQLQEYARLNEEYRFDQFPQELPFCIVIQRLNILDGFSYQFALNSIFNQNYSNFKAIILHEPETKGFDMVQEYLKANKINNKNFIHIVHKTPKSILRTIYDATHEYCSPDSISFPIHRSGELIGKNVLKVYNVLYQLNKVGLIYSNYYRYSRNNYVKTGANYNNLQQKLNNIRREVVFITNAITYRTNFFLSIPKGDILGDGYTYYDNVYEQALLFPLIEKMCGMAFKIDEYFLLTKQPFQTYSDYLEYVEKQKENSDMFRNKGRYSCNQTYTNEIKESFFIKSLNKLYLKDKQLQQISRDSRQSNAAIKHSLKTAVFEGNPKKAQTRKADRYIYNGSFSIVQSKRQYQMARLDYLDGVSQYQSYQLSKYNLFLGTGIDQQQQELEDKYAAITEKVHQLNLFSKYQVPLCIVIAELPARVGQYRFEYLLNSIFTQDYSNYFVVINNRNPTLDKFIRKYLRHYQINKEKYAYIQYSHTSAPLDAINKSLTQICHHNSFAMILSGKEELIGRKVFKIFSSKFRQNKYNLLYASGYNFNQEGKSVQPSISANYTLEERKGTLYRNSPRKYSNIMAFKTKMFSKVRLFDLQDANGKFLVYNWEEALYFPLLELSCSLNAQIEGGHYIRLRDLAQNDLYSNEIGAKLRNLKKYQCFHEKDIEISQAQQGTQPKTHIPNQRYQKGGIMLASAYRQPDLLQVNSKGQRIADYLYSQLKNAIAPREQNQHHRERASQKLESRIELELAMFNLKLDHTLDEVEASLAAEDYQKAKSIASFSSEKEHPFCVVIDLQLADPPFQFEYTLNSLFLQNYTNYFAVIFGDGSEKGDKLVQRYLEFYQLSHSKYMYLANEKKTRGVENIVAAAGAYCSKDSLILYLRETDEFAGRNVLKLLSWTHEKEGAQLIYSGFYLYRAQALQPIPAVVAQKDGSIRKAHTFTLSFAAFASDLFRKVDHAHFKDEAGNFFKEALDKALFLPMIELACAKTTEVKGAHFLRIDRKVANSAALQSQLKQISQREPYVCLKKP